MPETQHRTEIHCRMTLDSVYAEVQTNNRYHCCLQLLILFTQTIRITFPINLLLCDLNLVLLLYKAF